VVALLLALASSLAAPVQCDPLGAASLLAEARVEEHRAPISHPELIPGLALASPRTDSELRTALSDLCTDGATLSLAASEVWEGTGWSAHTFLLTRSETRGCTLFQRTIAISMGIAQGTAPRYTLRSRLPVTRTPVGDCTTRPAFREEEVLGGEEGPVRLLLARDFEGEEVVHSEVLDRRATAEGWLEQVLVEPAPSRLLDGGAGPRMVLTERHEDKWVVATGDRTGAPPDCEPLPGQTVWTPEGSRWVVNEGQVALVLLASRGLWRLAGQDGWFLIVAQEDEEDRELLVARARRLQKRIPDPIRIVPSAWFPGLNPGFEIAVVGPWATEGEAREAKSRWRSGRSGYVKRAWTAPDPCEEE